MITKKLLLAATLAVSALLPATVPAQSFSIEIGDRPYYRYGPTYWSGEYQMIWVPGHRSGRHWVHGHYVRGENRRHHRNWDRRNYRNDDRRDYRNDDRRDRRDEHLDDRPNDR